MVYPNDHIHRADSAKMDLVSRASGERPAVVTLLAACPAALALGVVSAFSSHRSGKGRPRRSFHARGGDPCRCPSSGSGVGCAGRSRHLVSADSPRRGGRPHGLLPRPDIVLTPDSACSVSGRLISLPSAQCAPAIAGWYRSISSAGRSRRLRYAAGSSAGVTSSHRRRPARAASDGPPRTARQRRAGHDRRDATGHQRCDPGGEPADHQVRRRRFGCRAAGLSVSGTRPGISRVDTMTLAVDLGPRFGRSARRAKPSRPPRAWFSTLWRRQRLDDSGAAGAGAEPTLRTYVSRPLPLRRSAGSRPRR